MGTHAAATKRRLLVIANETCTGADLFREIRERVGGTDAEVLVVAPALTSRLRYWISDEDPGIQAAGQRLARSIERCAAAGIPADGALGDADPLQALDDAVRSFQPDEVVIATHPIARSNWLERGLVAQARERFSMPITHVEVDAIRDESHVVATEPIERRAPARERHAQRDLAILGLAFVLAIGGSAVSAILYALGVSGWVLGVWVVVFDLGLKIAAAALIWILFQRRARADRLDF
jgi:hypothetical protein